MSNLYIRFTSQTRFWTCQWKWYSRKRYGWFVSPLLRGAAFSSFSPKHNQWWWNLQERYLEAYRYRFPIDLLVVITKCITSRPPLPSYHSFRLPFYEDVVQQGQVYHYFHNGCWGSAYRSCDAQTCHPLNFCKLGYHRSRLIHVSFGLYVAPEKKSKSVISHDFGGQFTDSKREINCPPNCSYNRTTGCVEVAPSCWNQISLRSRASMLDNK